jgi:hypothetical protein
MLIATQGGATGVAMRKTLFDEFFMWDSCFGLNSAKGIFSLKYIFRDFGKL